MPADEGSYVVQLEATTAALNAAAGHFGLDGSNIDPPDEGDSYRMRLQFSAPDEDDHRPRMIVDPYGDTWAAWPVVGALANAVAERLEGTDITADPLPWVQHQLAVEEQAPPARMPFLAVRNPSLFPRMVTVVPFGRAASVATIDRLMAAGQARLALVVQRDASSEGVPESPDDVEPIAIDARILKAVREDGRFTLLLKGIARLHVRDLDGKGELPAVIVDPVESGPDVCEGHAALRDFARFDLLVFEELGTSLQSRVDGLDIGFLADVVAKVSEDLDLAKRALLTVDPVERAAVVEEALGLSDR